MNININPNSKENTEGMLEIGGRTGIDKVSAGRNHLNIHASRIDQNAFLVTKSEPSTYSVEGLKSFDEIKAKASMKNVSLDNNAFAVMATSMSADDVAKMSDDGFSPSEMTDFETVTVLDKIKATLVKSGVDIKGFTDDLSKEQIEQIAGSSAYASAIEAALKEAALPATKDNVTEITEALNVSDTLEQPSDDAKKYMINNCPEPTVNNFYIANHSSSADTSANRASYYMDETGYVGKNPTDADIESLSPQIEKIISDAGLSVNEQTINEAKWLINKDIPLTKENLTNLENLESVSFPLDTETVAMSAASALAEGKNAKDGLLSDPESIHIKAAKFVESLNFDDVAKRRILEETRLILTLEASVSLLKKGINLDTKDLEKLVDDLKQAEKESYAPFLMENDEVDIKKYDDELTLKLDVFKQTVIAIEHVKTAPLSVVGDVAFSEKKPTLNEVAELSNKAKSEFSKAERSYETMMTMPRYDMGDSIKKAFRNVDDILADLEIEATRLNEKAVRILGYSGMEITEANIEKAVKAEVAVENVITHMTPARTLKMIRDGFNPLDTDIYELSNELLSEDEDTGTTKYTEFLYKLEKSSEITESEKSAFIGLYRLFRKIEKSDGKLVGDVIKADEKLTLLNIISASRSDRQVGTDIKIDDSFGALEKLITHGESITDQILQGFRTKELNVQYAKEEADEIRNIITKEEAIVRALENADSPKSPINMAAANMLLNSRGTIFKGLLKGLDEEEKDVFDKEISELADSFDDEDSVKNAINSFTEKTQEIIKNKAQIADKYIDVKSLKLLNKQLSIINKMADSRTYEVPVIINGSYTSINLKIVNDTENAGKVKAYFETEETGKVSAEFDLRDGKVSGIITTENSFFEGVIKEREDSFKEEFKGAGVEISSMYYVNKRGISVKGNYTDENDVSTPATKQLYSVAKAIIKAVQK
ncbi:MAG: DUF6240 domain-containing protein [Lachnospiraceae bacterium]|nr:DUF6240 domain-containing protein [Lachnospiraceae bacterium]MDY5639528.1 DUF6240 domain-containing protein [Lachnospiraceae bacterium]